MKRLYERYYAPLCSYAEKLLGGNTYAEDVVSSCLIKIWDTEISFLSLDGLTAWLFKSVYHAAIDVMREKNALQHFWEHAPFPDIDEETAKDMALREEAITYFYEILDLLPAQQREILHLTLQGHKVQEIAALLAISENTVKEQKKRAYRFVREHFDSDKLRLLLTLLFLSQREEC